MKPEEKGADPLLKNSKSTVKVASPGRINLIGEHTDYNQGFVLPTAIDKKIYFEIRKNSSDTACHIYSDTFKSDLRFSLNSFSKQDASWKNYVLGVVHEIQKKGRSLKGFDCNIKSELPIGAGISSSAAMECGLAAGLNELFDLGFSKMELVELCQQAENNFVGANCGIMDQYASVMSKKDQLILLDCQSLQAEFIPFNLANCQILLLNTNLAHNLAEGEYNIRRNECDEVVKTIKRKYDSVNSLRGVTFSILKEFRDELSETLYQRASYVLEENERVSAAVDAIKLGNLKKFGDLMYESHEGLRHQYETSCAELDFLVDFSMDKDFVHGARMMGGGFGGCTINIIEKEQTIAFVEEISKAYKKRFDIELDAITVSPDEGTVVEVV